MAFSFPTSPTLNQEYSFGSKTWRYNGTGWVLVTGVDTAQSAWSTANLAYIQANTATNIGQAAYDNSNTKFNSAGGTISGNTFITKDLTVGGNLSILGNTFTINAGAIISNDSLLLLGTGNYVSDILDIGFVSHYNDGVNAHTGFIRDVGTKEWYIFKGYVPDVNANNNVVLSDPTFQIDTLNANLRSSNIILNGFNLNSYINSAYYHANSGFIQANSGFIHANAAFDFANTIAGGLNTVNVSIDFSNDKINAAFNHANSGFIQANSGFIHANAAFNAANNALDTWVRGQANAAFVQANTSSNTGNSAFIQANSAFIHANAAFDAANNALDTWVRGQANAAFIKANSGFIHANAAFDFANTLSGGAAIDNVARITANSGFIQSNAAFDHANAAFIAANSSPGAIGNAAYIHANSAFFHANAGFIQANAGIIHAQSAYNQANSGFIQANAAFDQANSGFIQANASFGHANAAFANANGAFAAANAAYIQANAAFIRANNSLDANVGGTVSGDVRITGNLTVAGATTYVNTSTVLIADNIITLNAAINQASAPTVDAGLEVDRGNAANVYMLWNETEDRWTFTNDGSAYEGVGFASTAPYANAAFTVANGAFLHANAAFSAQNTTGQYANSAFAQANGAFIVANAASLQANAAFFHANGAYQSQNATGQYANAAFIHANSGFIQANAAFVWANASYDQANAAFTVANGAFFHANAGFIIANVALFQANAAFQVANVAILQANSAFFHANSGFVHANAAFDVANGAAANAASAGVYANSAYRHANAAFITGNSAFTQANAAFFHANGAFSAQNTTGQYANSAFIRANNSLNANVGGTVTGNVVVVGNVVADAFQTSGPAGDITGANAIFANYIFGANGSLDLTIHANAAFANANAAFAKANAAFIRANNSLDANNGGTITGVVNFTGNAIASYFIANTGVIVGGTNVVPTLAASFNTGNAAFNHANSAFDYANTATGAVVTFAAQPPASGNSNGHIWIDSADGTEYTYFKDSDTFQWVEFGPSSSNVSMNTYITADISSSYAHANAAFDKANSSITSDRLSSNLAINIIRVLETANIYTTAVSGNVNIDISNNTTYFFSSNTTGNVTFNLRANGNSGGIYDSLVNIGQTSTVAIALKQGSTRYKANLCIDGLLQTVYWLGNSAPNYATTQEQGIDVYSFVVFKTAANVYSVLAANSNFGLAQGQPGQG